MMPSDMRMPVDRIDMRCGQVNSAVRHWSENGEGFRRPMAALQCRAQEAVTFIAGLSIGFLIGGLLGGFVIAAMALSQDTDPGPSRW